MSHLINIFLEPAKVFADLKDKPNFWLPLLLSMSGMAVLMLLYFMNVDSDWYVDYAVRASSQDMSASEAAQMKQMMPGAKMTGYFVAPSTALVVAIMSLITALYLLIAGKVTGTAVSFKQGLSLTCWANMPTLLGVLIGIIGVLTMEPKTALESLMLTNVDPLILQLPVDHAWSGFAKGFNLLVFWTIFLLALGWRTLGRTSWTQAVVVAMLPSLLIYGCWALIVFLK